MNTFLLYKIQYTYYKSQQICTLGYQKAKNTLFQISNRKKVAHNQPTQKSLRKNLKFQSDLQGYFGFELTQKLHRTVAYKS